MAMLLILAAAAAAQTPATPLPPRLQAEQRPPEPTAPFRTSLATVPLADDKKVSRVEMMRVDFPALQTQERHIHPVPVLCFVAYGTFRTQLGANEPITYQTGDVFWEPPGVQVQYMQNLSDKAGRLYCTMLAGPADRVLSQVLPALGEGEPGHPPPIPGAKTDAATVSGK